MVGDLSDTHLRPRKDLAQIDLPPMK